MIAFDDVSFSYNESAEKSLNNVSLHIPKGQCVLLCGLSGCGKTTLARMINGLIPCFFDGQLDGKVTVHGFDPTERSISAISDVVGTVFQNPRTQFFNTDTDSEIVFGLENRGLPSQELRNRLEEVSDQLQIQNLRNRSIFNLSGGEKQKIAFASVYASNPEFFILDEPSSNLDYSSIKELRSLIGKIKDQGKTIVIAEHRIWYLMEIVDRVILMEKGRIMADMDIDKFRNLPKEQIETIGLRCRNLSEVNTSVIDINCDNRLLEVDNLTVKFENNSLLNRVSFSANGGDIIAIAGENGAGKTTLARAICGLLRQDSGNIFINGRKLNTKSRTEKSYMVMQDVGHQLFTDSVEAECKLGTKTESKTCIDETLSMLSLSELKDRHPLSLSGGQKQRLAVAISLLCDKEILIFDEPTSGLDLKSMREVGVLIERLSERGKILLVITHDIEFIKTICSRVLLLSDGKITADLKGKEKENIENYISVGGYRNE